jgi:hypothetical protein
VLKSSGFLQCRKSGCYLRNFDDAAQLWLFILEMAAEGNMSLTSSDYYRFWHTSGGVQSKTSTFSLDVCTLDHHSWCYNFSICLRTAVNSALDVTNFLIKFLLPEEIVGRRRHCM